MLPRDQKISTKEGSQVIKANAEGRIGYHVMARPERLWSFLVGPIAAQEGNTEIIDV